ncbi:MAG: Hpt domain-containing protein, partial [Treponema sp.]|nr:Hpt domain-containing protein [Treponema sp.]
HRLTHTLKSNAAHLGSSSLRAAAANLESLLKYGNNLSTDEHLLILKSELAYALAELTQEISDNAKLRKTDADAQNAKDSYFGNIQELIRAPVKESAQALIEEIAAMLNTGNPDCLKLALLLRQIPTDNSIHPLIEELIQNIENFDFEQAAVVLSDLKLEWGINSTDEHNLA